MHTRSLSSILRIRPSLLVYSRIPCISPSPCTVLGVGYRYKSKGKNDRTHYYSNNEPTKSSSSSSSSSLTKPTVPSSLNGPIIPTTVPSIGNKCPRNALESVSSSSRNTNSVVDTSSTTTTNGIPPVPAVYTEAPVTIDIRRQMIEAQIIPPKYEESVGQKARRWSYFVLGGIVGSIILGLYALSRSSSNVEELKIMEEIIQELRIERRKAKKALLACVQQDGEIKINNTTSLRWWATGPVDADIYIVLVGTDERGENAGVWGQVYAHLVHKLIRNENISSTTTTAALASNILHNKSVRIVTFHHKDLNAALDNSPHTLSKHRSITLGTQDIDKLIQSIHKPKSASYSGYFANGASTSSPQILLVEQGEGTWRSLAYAGLHVSNTIGVVSVSPLYFHRGKRMAWLDALPQLSRRVPLNNQISNNELIQAYLDPPPVMISPEMQQLMDARTPRRIETIKFLQNIGFRNIDDSLTKRFAEDFRTKKASEPVLSDIENIFLTSTVPKMRSRTSTETGTSGTNPIVRVITYGSDLLPSFIHSALHNHAEFYFLLAANTIGTFLVTEKERNLIHAQRRNLVDVLVTKTLTSGNHETNKSSTTMDNDSKFSLPSLEDLIPQTFDGIQLVYALRMFPVWLGWTPAEKVEESLGYQSMEKELKTFYPANFQVILLHTSPEKKTKFPSGVASLPLQCSSSIVEEIMDVLSTSQRLSWDDTRSKNMYRHREIT